MPVSFSPVTCFAGWGCTAKTRVMLTPNRQSGLTSRLLRILENHLRLRPKADFAEPRNRRRGQPRPAALWTPSGQRRLRPEPGSTGKLPYRPISERVIPRHGKPGGRTPIAGGHAGPCPRLRSRPRRQPTSVQGGGRIRPTSARFRPPTHRAAASGQARANKSELSVAHRNARLGEP